MDEETKEQFVEVARKVREVTGDPSAFDDNYSVDPMFLEVKSRILSLTGVEFEVACTRHVVAFALFNTEGFLSFEFELDDDLEVEGVVEALILDMTEADQDGMDILLEAGYCKS